MPAAIPAVAAMAAAGWATAGGVTILGMGVMASSVVVGALAGAVVGGLTSAITGGDIGEGVLWGAVGGAVGGALGGAYSEGYFSLLGAGGGTSEAVGSAAFLGPTEVATGVNETTGLFNVTNAAAPSALETGVTGGGTGGLLSGDMTKFAMAQGGMGLLSSATAKTDYTKTEEGTTAALAQRERENQMSKENTLASLQQRQREAELQAQLAREKSAQDASEFDKTIAQRKLELQTPYDEAAAARKRMIDTTLGLRQTITRTPTSPVSEEINNYIYG